MLLMRLEFVCVLINAWPHFYVFSSAKHISSNPASRSVSLSANGRKFLSFFYFKALKHQGTQAPNQLLLLTLYANEMHNSDKSTKTGPRKLSLEVILQYTTKLLFI